MGWWAWGGVGERMWRLYDLDIFMYEMYHFQRTNNFRCLFYSKSLGTGASLCIQILLHLCPKGLNMTMEGLWQAG